MVVDILNLPAMDSPTHATKKTNKFNRNITIEVLLILYVTRSLHFSTFRFINGTSFIKIDKGNFSAPEANNF